MVNATSTVYDLTNTTTTNTVFGFVESVNNLTGQWFMVGVLLVSFIILMVSFVRFGTEDSFLAAGFITTVLTIFFATLNLVPVWLVTSIVLVYGIFFSYRMVNG